MAATPRHVVFGTGAIGLATLDALRRRGESVRLVNRSGTAPVPDDIEVLGGTSATPPSPPPPPAELDVHATPLDRALADTLATYRTNPAA